KSYEEKQAKRKEIFFNSVLAHDEIDRLFDHKALTNWKRFTKDGEQEVKEIKRDEDGTIRENLIIKGNNLLALHSLKKQFTGKVKLIYIDPPYNTGNDGFKYNDNFNHSTWLTFMKNRLEVARELLRDDGVIFVQCDDNEQAYLKVLMDEVFGRENFVNHVSVRVKSSAGFKTVNKGLMETSEYIYIFAKNKRNAEIKNLYKETGYDKNYNLVVVNPNDNYKKWQFGKIDDFCFVDINLELFPKNLIEIIKFQLRAEYANKNSHKVFRYTAINSDAGKETLEAKKKSLNTDEVFRVETSKGIRYIHKGQQITFYSMKFNEVDGKLVPSQQLTNIWEDIAWEGIANEGKVELKKGKKPEKLLQRIIEMSTEKNDIVLDYHLGSGTTCAVAHKMGRQYIGIEQLDYRENDSVVRLQNVINGEQGGISKSVNWQGGGDFIYFELAKWNETAKEKILECESLEELEKFFDEMYEKYFLNYNLKIKEFGEKVLQEENFRNLSLDEQKKIFIAMLDNNQMYVNKTEMADKKFGISEEDQNLTNQFYNKEE
ncbi:MAG: site-specific DNA-methyltransferase, partial [Bacteroidales bacterium]|nr:site-specific DNA-methyltransferase [Bacteroidales bacterium]